MSSDGTETGSSGGKAVLAEARQLVSLGNLESAIDLLNRSLQAEQRVQNRHQILALLLSLLAQRGRLGEGETIARTFLSTDPLDALHSKYHLRAVLNFAAILAARGLLYDSSSLLAELSLRARAQGMDSDEQERVDNMLATLLLSQSKNEPATAQTGDSNPRLQVSRATALFNEGQFAECVEICRSVLRHRNEITMRTSVVALSTLGLGLAELSSWREALDALLEAHKLVQRNSSAAILRSLIIANLQAVYLGASQHLDATDKLTEVRTLLEGIVIESRLN